jgi:hypothetical protein
MHEYFLVAPEEGAAVVRDWYAWFCRTESPTLQEQEQAVLVGDPHRSGSSMKRSHRAGLDPARPVKRGGRFSRKAATPSARSGVRAAIAWLRASMFRTSSSDMPSPW